MYLIVNNEYVSLPFCVKAVFNIHVRNFPCSPRQVLGIVRPLSGGGGGGEGVLWGFIGELPPKRDPDRIRRAHNSSQSLFPIVSSQISEDIQSDFFSWSIFEHHSKFTCPRTTAKSRSELFTRKVLDSCQPKAMRPSENTSVRDQPKSGPKESKRYQSFLSCYVLHVYIWISNPCDPPPCPPPPPPPPSCPPPPCHQTSLIGLLQLGWW